MSDTRLLLVLGGLLASSNAWALPWNIDMADSEAIKAYERVMRPLPAGVMSQPNLLTPMSYRANFVRETPEGQALTNPLPTDEKTLALGEKYYGIYCTPCHGDGINLGPVAAPGRYPGVAVLAGEGGRLKMRTDGHVYLTIRNGGGIMPGYTWAMNDAEMWSIVTYMREKMPDSKAPAPAATEAAPATDAAAPAGGAQ